jgi:hypothetical protein
MPVKKCILGGEPGYKWGDQGKCYIGKDAKEKAYNQGIAIGEYELASYNDYPQAASNNAKRALKWVEENGWGDCGEATGKARANQLANRENISRDTIARMASFKRHQQHKDVPYSEGCGGLMWDAWGGDAGIEWAQRKLDEIDKLSQINEFREALAIRRVSFDYDGTLTQANVQDIVKRLLTSRATKIYIISARTNIYAVYSLARKLGIPIANIYATGSNKAKIEKIKELGIDKHYDNNKDVIDALGNIGELI